MTLQQLSGLFSARARLIGTGLAVWLMLMAGAAVPSMAQERLDKGLAIIRACGADGTASLLGRAARHRTRQRLRAGQMGSSLPGPTRSSTRWLEVHSRLARIRLMRFAPRHAAMCMTVSPTVSVT